MNRLSFATALAFVVGLGQACGGIAVLDDPSSGGAGQTSGTTRAASSSRASATVGTTKATSAQTGSVDPCTAPIGAPCDPGAFPLCAPEKVPGVPCCNAVRACDTGTIAWAPTLCTDDCSQSCVDVTDPMFCEALAWCSLTPRGCRFDAQPDR